VTLDEAAGHINGPVLVDEPGRRRVRSAVVRSVDVRRGVRVERCAGGVALRGSRRVPAQRAVWVVAGLEVAGAAVVAGRAGERDVTERELHASFPWPRTPLG
jgi:hypothetical protein